MGRDLQAFLIRGDLFQSKPLSFPCKDMDEKVPERRFEQFTARSAVKGRPPHAMRPDLLTEPDPRLGGVVGRITSLLNWLIVRN